MKTSTILCRSSSSKEREWTFQSQSNWPISVWMCVCVGVCGCTCFVFLLCQFFHALDLFMLLLPLSLSLSHSLNLFILSNIPYSSSSSLPSCAYWQTFLVFLSFELVWKFVDFIFIIFKLRTCRRFTVLLYRKSVCVCVCVDFSFFVVMLEK